MIRYLNENINCHECCSVKHCNTVTLWMVKILNSYYPEAHGTQYHGSAATEYCGIDILAKTFWIHSSAFPLSVTDKQSLSNLQKKEVCTLLFVPVKCFKICHISCNTKTQSCFFRFSFRATLLFSLMNAPVYVDIDLSIH